MGARVHFSSRLTRTQGSSSRSIRRLCIFFPLKYNILMPTLGEARLPLAALNPCVGRPTSNYANPTQTAASNSWNLLFLGFSFLALILPANSAAAFSLFLPFPPVTRMRTLVSLWSVLYLASSPPHTISLLGSSSGIVSFVCPYIVALVRDSLRPFLVAVTPRQDPPLLFASSWLDMHDTYRLDLHSSS